MLKEALSEIERGSVEIIDSERIEKLLKAYFEEGKTYTVNYKLSIIDNYDYIQESVVLQKLAEELHLLFVDLDSIDMDYYLTGKVPFAQLKKYNVIPISQDDMSVTVAFNDPLNIEAQEVIQRFFPRKVLKIALSTKKQIASYLYKISLKDSVKDLVKKIRDELNSISSLEEQQDASSILLLIDVVLKTCISSRSSDIHVEPTEKNCVVRGRIDGKLTEVFIEGLDGVNKMSKSLGNYIGVTDNANDMFGKVLSISDELMWRYFELLSVKSLEDIKTLKLSVENGSAHPKVVKESLALEITERFHSKELAQIAKQEFERVHAKSQIPSEVNEFSCEGEVWIAKALVDCEMEPSTSQARRDIKQGGVKIDQEKVTDVDLQLSQGEYLLQVGKRKFAKLKVK